MIELRDNELKISFPHVHEAAEMSLDFKRTLRIPDDGRDYPLPPGLGSFPIRHVDDYADRLPELWRKHGGVMLPMHQSEALWLNFKSDYPFAVKVATGKINAITGETWRDGIHRDPQDYMVIPKQPWLDGYCIEEGSIRQFVAMPLGNGYTVEEQITGEAAHGGLQIVAYPMKAEAYRRMRERSEMRRRPLDQGYMFKSLDMMEDMGLAQGGRMRQEVYEDPDSFDVWDTRTSSRCFVHIANSLAWGAITGTEPPTRPLSAWQYSRAGLPWFDLYGTDGTALNGAAPFNEVKTVKEMGEEKGEKPLPENKSLEGDLQHVRVERSSSRIVREGL